MYLSHGTVQRVSFVADTDEPWDVANPVLISALPETPPLREASDEATCEI